VLVLALQGEAITSCISLVCTYLAGLGCLPRGCAMSSLLEPAQEE
jgi:hypothetical protein